MKAYELFCQDLLGDELVRKPSDRRSYYRELRQALKEEVAAGAECELLRHLADRLQSGAPGYMYLLDAAALWECHDTVVEGVLFQRDIGQGLPFPLENGHRLSWAEVQHKSDMHMLPVAVADEELRARLQGLLAYAAAPGAKAGTLSVPPVNHRARLCMADAKQAGSIPFGTQAAPQPEGAGDRVSELEEQVRRLKEANGRLREKVEALQKDAAPQQDSGDAVRLTELILHNRMSEAAAEASRLGGHLESELQRLQEAQAELAAIRQEIDLAQAQLKADSEQTQALRAQRRATEQAAAAARSECAQAQSEAAARQKEKQEAEKQLGEARAELSRQNAALRALQRQRAQTQAAADLTRRQVELLS